MVVLAYGTSQAELRGCAVLSKQFGRQVVLDISRNFDFPLQHFGIEVKLHSGNKIHFAAQGLWLTTTNRWFD